MSTTAWLAIDTVEELARAASAEADTFLSAPERARLLAISGIRRRAQFRAGRLLMRRLLARVHGGDPLTDWPLSAHADASPTFLGEAFAQQPGTQWHMSISHSHNYVACAVAASRIGIDIEVHERERDVLALGEVLCSVDEFAHLQSLEGAARADYFLVLWTLKEAALKRESGRSLFARAGTVNPVDPRAVADAWTWQSTELTLAVVTDSKGVEPQWAFPPPAFVLQNSATWTIDAFLHRTAT